ncbi:uncharacterized protein LOC126656782 [Mercurialis annua]|uniref:uncharacterized protein LOC126656782 n=1 Tax=Mercurialis annua TaxID=3986 RepID=UPI00215F8682|nr:uncharacterized protein LOC126656782 [Mercurialis annua]
MEYKIGNGTGTEFWYDPWINGCTIMEKFSRVKMRDSDIPRNFKVADLWRNNRWDFPDPIDEASSEVWEFIKQNYRLRDDIVDSIEWNVLKNDKFSISRTWKIYRTDYNSLPWFKIVWGKNYVPKHSFILWLAIKNRLKTKDKLKRWGVTPDDHCVLCILLLKFGKPWLPFEESIRTLDLGEELSVGLAERALERAS